MLNLYTEVAIQARPVTDTSIVERQIPRKNGSFDESTHGKTTKSHGRDEADYSKHFLSSAGGVYSKTERNTTPHSYLWKITGDDRVLHLQSADLARKEQDIREACLTLRFIFQDAIREHAIGFSDSDDGHLHAFVSTTKNDLIHLDLPPTAFKSTSGLGENIQQWCHPIDASSLIIDTVFRLQVQSPYEIFVAYTSGKVQRLQRKAESSNWDSNTYDDRTWGSSLNGLLRGAARKIEYGPTYVDSRTPQAMQASSDSTYLYTVCLNHQLRVWNLSTGKLVVTKDLLDYDGEVQDRTLSAFDRGHLQHLHSTEMRGSMLVTFSPRDGGQFKIWDVRGGLTDTLGISDRYPGIQLTPPDPDPTGNTVWSMVSFRLVPLGGLDSRGSAQLWVLWRNNNHHKLYSVQFDFDDIERGWAEQNWVSSTAPPHTRQGPDVVTGGSEDVSTAWIEFLTTSGRYPTEVLETALAVYTAPSKAPGSAMTPLATRICAAIAPNAHPKKQDVGGMNYEAFSFDVDQAWRSFHRTAEKINDTRLGPLALSYDDQSAQPYLVLADELVLVRESDRLELVLYNQPADLASVEIICMNRWPHRQTIAEEGGVSYNDLTQLLSASQKFKDDLPSQLVQSVEDAITDLMYANHERTLPTRILEIYDDLNFGEAVSDDTFSRLERNFKPLGGIETLNNQLIHAAISLLPEGLPRDPNDLSNISTIFGLECLSRATSQYLRLVREMLYNLLILVIFEEGEFNQEDNLKVPGFDAAEIFVTIMPVLKTVERNLWLSTHTREVPVALSSQKGASATRTTSSLDDTLLRAVKPQKDASKPSPYLLMAHLHESLDYISHDDPGYDNATVGLLCDMLQRGEIDLATDFVQFAPTNCWASYVKGRLALLRDEFDYAAQHFRQASFGLSHGKAVQSLSTMSFGFVRQVEIDSFYHGTPRYLRHILDLFDAMGAYAQSSVFARAALQAVTPEQKLPAAFRTEVLSRLFTANLQLSRYRDAFDTITQFTDTALQKTCASALVTAIINASRTATSVQTAILTLQSLPWSLHPRLAKQLDDQLNILAKKQKSIATDDGPFNSAESSVDYLKIVHAIRLAQGDYRGAVTALYERLRLVERQGRLRADPQSTVLRHALLALINVMTCVPADEAYILTDGEERQENKSNGEAGKRQTKRRRIIVTLADLRREYQQVLDRCARIERGDFGFSDGEEDDDDDEDMQLLDGPTRMELTILPNGNGEGGGLLAY